MKPAANGIAGTPHKTMTCFACHADAPLAAAEAKTAELVRMYPASLSSEATLGAAPVVPSSACKGCHQAVLRGTVEKNGLKIEHSACAEGTVCGDCHTREVHGGGTRWARGPSMERCTSCHLSEGAPIGCDLCHSGRLQSERLATGSWRVTHGSSWEKTHGMGDLTSCGVCHPADYCARCHGISLPHSKGFAGEHGKTALTVGSDRCTTCHDGKEFCSGCHGIDMPHPDGFVRAHSTVAKSRSDKKCAKCHEVKACETCHAQHVHPGYGAEAAKAARESLGTNR